MTIRQTHTLATLDVPASMFDMLRIRLQAAGYDHAILANFGPGPALDMSGIALTSQGDDRDLIRFAFGYAFLLALKRLLGVVSEVVADDLRSNHQERLPHARVDLRKALASVNASLRDRPHLKALETSIKRRGRIPKSARRRAPGRSKRARA